MVGKHGVSASAAPCVQVVLVLDAVALDASQQMGGVGGF